MTTFQGTPLPTDLDTPIPAAENNQVEQLNEDTAPRRPDISNDAPKAPEQEEAPKTVRDPRAEHMREIADRANERRRDEDRATKAAFGQTEPAPAPTPPQDSDYVDLKVRRQTHRLTVRERNAVLMDDFDQADIDGMSEDERNRSARQILAMRSYQRDLETEKEKIKEARSQPQIQYVEQSRPTEPVEPEKTPREIAQANYEKALEDLEFGVEGARAKVIEATAELSGIIADERQQVSQQSRQQQIVDQDIDNGFASVEARWRQENSPIIQNPVMIGTFKSTVDQAMRGAIVTAVANADEQVQMAFNRGGVTREFVQKTATPEQITGLYKDMVLKRYSLPQPSLVISEVAKYIESQLAPAPLPATPGIPSEPVAQGHFNGVDRSDRKAEISNQPGRAAIPRPGGTQQQQQPQTEQERARVNRENEKAARRGKQISVR